MPVIVFTTPKGGAGKTTSALLLASELAARSATVAIIDADPEKWISQWGALPGRPANVTITSDVTEDSIVDQIEAAAAEAQFVVVDLEGTASLMVANAIGMSDLVIIPTQGASMDAKGAAKTIRLIRNQARMARREIAHAVLLTRTSAAVASRSLRNVRDQLDQAGIPVFETSIVERACAAQHHRDLRRCGREGRTAYRSPHVGVGMDLTRTDASQNVHRFYRMEIVAGLFGDWSLVREWGRIGQPGQVWVDWFDTEAAAKDARFDILMKKSRRGYA